jgi:haloalkane dehalogenase
MKYLRTADDRFASLPDWPYAPHYLFVDDTEGGELRMHYVDEGPHAAPPVLLLHGEPSWSYLYRTMIPGLVAVGHRVIAPDLIGFGRSDKPVSQSDYSYARHAHWLASLIAQLELTGITMFCQDWGGLLGLRLLGERPARFARVVAANTFLPTGEAPIGEAFEQWRAFSQATSDFSAGSILDKGTLRALDPAVRAAYDAPFPSDLYKAGARSFPMLVPTEYDDPEAAANRDAWKGLDLFDRPFLTAFGDSDPITRGADRVLQKRIPGAAGQPHCTIERAGHFLQEDQGPRLAEIINEFIENTREA